MSNQQKNGELPPREEREPIVVSNSSIQTWKDCRRKYWLSYMRRLRPKQEKKSGPLALGSRVHSALETYYGELLENPALTDRDRLMEIWADLVKDDRLVLEAEGQFTDDFDNEAELGRIMLEGYYDWVEEEGIDSRYEIIGLEDTLEYPFHDGQVRVVGKLDQRVRDTVDGTLLVRDFKTSANFADLMKTLEMNEQFLLYMTLEHLLKGEGDRVSGAIVTALKKVKRTANARPPFYTNERVDHNVFTLRSFYKHLVGVSSDILNAWRDVEDGADPHIVMYPHPTRDCSWKCPFAAGCSMFDNGGAAEQWLADNFEVGSPFAYYGDSDPTKKTATPSKGGDA